MKLEEGSPKDKCCPPWFCLDQLRIVVSHPLNSLSGEGFAWFICLFIYYISNNHCKNSVSIDVYRGKNKWNPLSIVILNLCSPQKWPLPGMRCTCSQTSFPCIYNMWMYIDLGGFFSIKWGHIIYIFPWQYIQIYRAPLNNFHFTNSDKPLLSILFIKHTVACLRPHKHS